MVCDGFTHLFRCDHHCQRVIIRQGPHSYFYCKGSTWGQQSSWSTLSCMPVHAGLIDVHASAGWIIRIGVCEHAHRSLHISLGCISDPPDYLSILHNCQSARPQIDLSRPQFLLCKNVLTSWPRFISGQHEWRQKPCRKHKWCSPICSGKEI